MEECIMDPEVNYVSEVIKCRIATVALRADKILHIDIAPDEIFVVDDFNEIMAAAYKIGRGKKFLNLITVAKDTVPDHESRAMSTSKEGSIYKLADAFVITSLAQKLVGNFYMNFHKPYVPTHFFNNEQEAVKWLKKQEVLIASTTK
jgi:hypothetical protein